VESSEVHLLTQVEDWHWWYAERRRLLDRALAHLEPGDAVDVGAAGGGNTRVLVHRGWRAVALEYGEEGARVCAQRGIPVLRGDATALPLAPASVDLIVAYDVLEHLKDDEAAVRCAFEALRPGGTFLVAVPVDQRLWSAHDVAVGHVRRYQREELTALLVGAGFVLEDVRSWMVLLRPAVALRRRVAGMLRDAAGSDLDAPAPWLNRALGAVVAVERHLPVASLPGVSMVVRARRF
jgi:SAM-dependent methyltransferase